MATQETAGPIAPYHDEERWRAEREKGIGGSEIAAIFGEHPYITAYDLWERKTGRGQPTDPTPIMERGRVMEPVIASIYEKETGRKARRMPMRRHPDHPFLLASVDRQILAGSGEGEWATEDTLALEIKSLGWRSFSAARREGLAPYMILQGQQEALVTGYPRTSFALHNADSWRLVPFDVEADADTQQMIINEAGEWWERYVVGDTPPPERTLEELDLPEVSGDVLVLESADFARAVDEYLEAQALAKEAGAVKKDARDRLIDLVGEDEYGAYQGGNGLVYYNIQDGRTQYAQTLREVRNLAPLDPIAVQSWLLGKNGPITMEMLQRLREDCQLDVDGMTKTGKPFSTVRVYPLREEE